jgi:hypothetical protein
MKEKKEEWRIHYGITDGMNKEEKKKKRLL